MYKSRHITKINRETTASIGNSLRNNECSILIGLIKEHIPKTKAILAMQLPIILPIARFSEPFIAAVRLTKSSGADVANAATVAAIISGLILNN